MKKTKLLYLFPAAALLLSGCTFQEGWDATKTWISDHIVSPISSLFGGKQKEEKSSDSTTPANSSTTPSDGSTTPGDGSTTPKEATFTLIQSNSTLHDGDKVAITTLQTGSSVEGVSGWSGSKDATTSTTKSSWQLFTVGSASSSGWTLYDSSASKYIASPSSNEFKYDTSGGICSVSSEGQLVCNSRTLCKNSTYIRFYTSIGSYTPFYVYKVDGTISDDTTGGGGQETPAEFPSATVNAFTQSLGSSIQLPAFSGAALSYEFDSEYGTLDIEVGQGNETAAVATYQSDLLGSNNFVQGATDQYGDKHYISTDNILDVCAWDGNDASTAAPGHIYVDIIEYVEPSTTLPTTQVNTFLSSNSFGFTISSSVESSLNALSNSFTVTESTYNGYPIMLIEMSGDIASSVDAALSPTLIGASYEAYTGDDLDEGEYYYSNETSYTSVFIYAQNGITTIQLY